MRYCCMLRKTMTINTKTKTYHPLESEPPSDPNMLEWAIVASLVVVGHRLSWPVALQAALAEQPVVLVEPAVEQQEAARP